MPVMFWHLFPSLSDDWSSRAIESEIMDTESLKFCQSSISVICFSMKIKREKNYMDFRSKTANY